MPDARVIVCGGRTYGVPPENPTPADIERARDERYEMFAFLDSFAYRFGPVALLIAGGARGADSLAVEWAVQSGIDYVIEPAEWEQDGRKAGPLRNQRMIDKHAPTHVIAFLGGRGTADMIRRARRASIPVLLAGAIA